ncbi:hypothetical protein HA43_18200 [Pantoea eucrina]|nr:hypothetical protein HA43_18200 [Pantoea eucrina]
MVDDYQKIDYETKKKLALAKEGYVYALAATLTLQKNNPDKQFNFITPSYLEKIKELSKDNVGFLTVLLQNHLYIATNSLGKKNSLLLFEAQMIFLKIICSKTLHRFRFKISMLANMLKRL